MSWTLEGCISIILQLFILLLLLLILTMFVKTFSSYVDTKPPAMVSLIDLLNKDMSIVYLSGTALSLIVHVVRILEIDNVPSIVAAPLGLAMSCNYAGLYIYILLGVIIQYILVKHRSTSFTERFTDEQIRKGILFCVVTLTTLTFVPLGIIYGPGRTFSLYHALVGNTEQDQHGPFPFGILSVFILGTLAVVVNIFLRFLISMEKKDVKQAKEEETKRPPYVAYIFAVGTLFVVVFLGLLSFAVRRFIIISVVCVFIPSVLAFRNNSYKMYLLKLARNKKKCALNIIISRFSRRVKPELMENANV